MPANDTTRTPLLKSTGQRNLRRNFKKAYPRNQKERGEWVELLFTANAARMGLKVAKPHGDSARYDVIVQGGGKLHRVQVKPTMFNRKGLLRVPVLLVVSIQDTAIETVFKRRH